MAKLVSFKDTVCACTTSDCVAAATVHMEGWTEHCSDPSVKLTDMDQKAAESVGFKAGTCISELERRLRGPGIDRSMITKAIGGVKSRVNACGDASRARGKVKLKVEVAPDAKLTVLVLETPETVLGDCVASAVRAAVFPKTQAGGIFMYPFVF